MSKAPLRELTDPRVMRALAHPVRLPLLEMLVRDGPLTATQAAELVRESPANCSWHLRQLAKYGFVEEASGGKGHNRPWRIVSYSHRWSEASSDSETMAAGEALTCMWVERNIARPLTWMQERRMYPVEWQNASIMAENLLYRTPEELIALHHRFLDMIDMYTPRVGSPEERPKGAQPVALLLFGFPLPPTLSGG